MEDKDAKKAYLSRLFWWENTECPLKKYTYISVIIHSTQEVNILKYVSWLMDVLLQSQLKDVPGHLHRRFARY
jgi:hypothetical protein